MSMLRAAALNLIFGTHVHTSFMFFTNSSFCLTLCAGIPKRNSRAPRTTDTHTTQQMENWRYRLLG